MKNNIDTLIMSATPIPRTLALSMYGDMDLSIINEKPKNRKPIITSAVSKNSLMQLLDRIKLKIKAGEKIYWICPLVEESENLQDVGAVTKRYEFLKEHFKEQVALLHGTLKESEKNKILDNFTNGTLNLLISTTVIEVGIDVPSATIIVIENPERFGLSQIHQLRGRVGRGEQQSYCILLYGEKNSENAIKRMEILKNTDDGFKIAEEDLKLRGSGDILGTRQSGLQEWKFADLQEHYELLLKASKVAKEINDKDCADLLNIFGLENKGSVE